MCKGCAEVCLVGVREVSLKGVRGGVSEGCAGCVSEGCAGGVRGVCGGVSGGRVSLDGGGCEELHRDVGAAGGGGGGARPVERGERVHLRRGRRLIEQP